jgi:hypothetical protein
VTDKATEEAKDCCAQSSRRDVETHWWAAAPEGREKAEHNLPDGLLENKDTEEKDSRITDHR